MEINRFIKELYKYLSVSVPTKALDIIIENDVRVENYFTIQLAVFFSNLKEKLEIKEYKLQKHFPDKNYSNEKKKLRLHVDFSLTTNDGKEILIELKHCSIALKRPNGRRLQFYTNDSNNGKKVGVLKDCIKLDEINDTKNIVSGYKESKYWNFDTPIDFKKQNEKLAMFYLHK